MKKIKLVQYGDNYYPINYGLGNRKEISFCSYFGSHRGFCSQYPENTMPAFKAAIEHGYYLIETDIVQSSDGIQFCLHDRSVDRTSNGTGVVSNLTSSYIQSLDFGYKTKFGNKFKNTPISTLEDFLLFCKRHGCYAELDLADDSRYTDSYLQNTYNVVKACNMLNATFFCARTDRLKKLCQIDNTVMMSVSGITSKSLMDSANSEFTQSRMKNFSIPYNNVTKELVQYAHSLGVYVKTYYPSTSNDTKQNADTLFGYGMECILTDYIVPNEYVPA